MKKVLLFFLLMSIISCQTKKGVIKPSYISFSFKNDSIFVHGKSELACPTFMVLKNVEKDSIINFKAFEEKIVFVKKDKKLDTLQILKKQNPRLKYGNYPLKKYDTNYNYNLPFIKGKRYKIMQGHFGKFSHYSETSRHAIDFRMNVGQEVCAMRDGIVVNVKEDSNIGGKNQKYMNDGNYVLIYHNDGTFSSYFHLKQNGAIVEKNDTVKKGQVIAYSGNTGFSTAPHLHFAIYKPGLNGFVSIPYILDSIPSRKYVKGKFAVHN